MPKSKGRTYRLQKRMSHFTLVLTDEVAGNESVAKETKIEKPIKEKVTKEKESKAQE
jgi:hypothetical protein